MRKKDYQISQLFLHILFSSWFFFQKNVMLGLGKVTLVRERGEKERVKVKICRELNLSSRSEVGLISSRAGRLNL